MVLFPKPNLMKVAVIALLALTLVLGPLPVFAQRGQAPSEAEQAKIDEVNGVTNDSGGLWGLVRRGLQFSPTYQVLMLPGRIVRYFESRAERRAAEQSYRADTKRKEAAEGMGNWPAVTGENTTGNGGKPGTVDAGHGGTKPGTATNPGTGTKGNATGGTVSPTSGTKGGTTGGTVSPGTSGGTKGGGGSSGGTGTGSGTGKPTPTDPEDDKKKSGASVITAFEEGMAGVVNWVRSVIGF